MSDDQMMNDENDLETIDLGVMVEGVSGSTTQWAAITAAASHRRQRRSWLMSAAAVLLLVVGSVAVVVSRSDEDVVTAAAGSSDTAQWAIPPQEAEITAVEPVEGMTSIRFTIDGVPYLLGRVPESSLSQMPTEVDQPSVAMTLEDYQQQMKRTPVQTPGGRSAFLMCSAIMNFTPSDAPAYSSPAGPSLLTWASSGWGYVMVPQVPEATPGPCGADDPDPSALLEIMDSLRYVDDAGWQAFLAGQDGEQVGHAEMTTTTTSPEDPAPSTSSTTTTVVGDAPADGASVEE